MGRRRGMSVCNKGAVLRLLAAGGLALAVRMVALAQPVQLNVVILEGQDAVHNVRDRAAREPAVRVEDQNHQPLAGATVEFTLPSRGAGGAFADGSHTFRVATDQQGRAAAQGLIPNHVKGSYQIRVTVSRDGATASAVIDQSNAAGTGGGAAAASSGITGKVIVILAVAAAAAAGGAYAASHAGNGNNTPATTGATITAGTGTVGPPR